MFETWQKNIRENQELVRQGAGPALVTVVSGSEFDQVHWQHHFAKTCRDVFKRTGEISIVSVLEKSPKGNFLGTIKAWAETARLVENDKKLLPDVALMSMVFGKGRRLSPFTQALGNRKAAFLTPLRAQSGVVNLCAADISNLYSNNWLDHLSKCGFRGLVVKWGDEAIIPGTLWKADPHAYRNVDAVRFVWETEITERLAREKEWILIEKETGLMKFQCARGDFNHLKMRISNFGERKHKAGVNLGSLAITYEFLDTALKIFGDDISDFTKFADWDPYVWIALFCRNESEWRAEAEYERSIGKTGMQDLEERYPEFYLKVTQLRNTFESRMGRPLRVSTLDFGQAFWTDIGLHITLRKSLESLIIDSETGKATRELFNIPHERDKNGNIIMRSVVNESADIRDSVIIDSVILNKESVLREAVVINCRHRTMHMPYGGSSLFCASDQLDSTGPHGIAFRSLGSKIEIPVGGRHTTLFLPQGPVNIMSNETIVDYSGETYEQPILGNPLSFKEAGEIMSKVNSEEIEAQWANVWQHWLE